MENDILAEIEVTDLDVIYIDLNVTMKALLTVAGTLFASLIYVVLI